MRLITWNINSVRLRLDLLMKLIDKHKPDVFCLQETKTPDEFFPVDAIVAKGYPYYHFTGMKGYNGVAIFSKYPLSEIDIFKRVGKMDTRHISAKVKAPGRSFELHNVYIPAGGDLPDPVANEKFKHKLDFVDELAKWFPKHRDAKDPIVLVGDLNIAPLEHDVWDHKKMLKVVSHTPIEVEKFGKFQQSIGWVDAVRHFVPENQKVYSWWSYRAKENWDSADRGRRLDHVWTTNKMKGALKQHKILRDMRDLAHQPSDHVPIIVDFEF